MSIRDFLIPFYDALHREPQMIKKYYHEVAPSIHIEDSYVFMADGRIPHGGMFDRLKGLISVYALAKCYGIPFRIHFTHPFRLERYLEPNTYDWRVSDGKMVYHYPDSRPVIAYGEIHSPWRLMKRWHGQVHFYYGYNSLEAINHKFGTHYEWGALYRELFNPTPYLQRYLDHYQGEIGRDYFVIHTRFMNLLGDKMETPNNPVLPETEKRKLIRQVIDKMREVVGLHQGHRLMLASDSMTFVAEAMRIFPESYVVPGKIKHIGTAGETDDTENIKMFTDYYLIACAQKVYNIVAKGMWPSAFPEYAAKIGNVPFERVRL
jgi:hypothetical protein